MTARSDARGDTAFEALYRAYHTALFNYLCRLLGSRSEAEEVMQDAFIKAYRALGNLAADANERAWLYRIATNAAHDRLRRRRLLQWLPLQETNRATTVLDRPEETATGQADVARALARLKPGYREALWLYVVEEYDTATIGVMLGISQAAAKKRVARAREQFERAYHEGG